jgi:alpha-amylase/alpha-mannosidase (GH57 family)
MSNKPVTSVLFLWHQHQPFYKDPLSNRYEMPWVRLHATKDYFDMVALLQEFPKIRMNFNLVPSLLQQLDDYGQGKAHDKHLALSLKPAGDLSFEERIFILNNFFMANWDTMIDPIPRYRELLEKRGRFAGSDELGRVQNYFKEQDWRDLQVWFNLTWFDPYWTEHEPAIRALREKGKNFSEDDKRVLVEKQQWICQQVVPEHKRAQERGQIEISATPFYHPILPLLCDSDAARMAMPQVVLPRNRFAFPEDARTQIARALDDHEARFGRRPRGMWPSEGSVSDATARLMIECGVQWIATDEAILTNTLRQGAGTRDQIYEPHRLELDGKSISMFFRDHELSDAIGFVYTTWNPTDAVADFMKRLRAIRERLVQSDGDKPRPHVIPVILDGENCWEYYREDGVPFLRGLYRALSEDPDFETVLASDYLAKNPPVRQLSSIWSGSWINANFHIWIGHREDTQAWDLLYRTRQFLVNYQATHPESAGSAELKLAWDEIYIAEGSDWTWWYGEDHSSANDETFDYLFRKHLMNVYAALGSRIPDDLRVAIKPKRSRLAPKPPVDFITPKMDGKISSYFEWQNAGSLTTEPGATGTMHRAQNMIKSIYYGYDLHNLYFRFDLAKPPTDPAFEPMTFKILFMNPDGYEAVVKADPGQPIKLQLVQKAAGREPATTELTTVAAAKILEFGVPIKLFAGHQSGFEWVAVLEKDGLEQERWPNDSAISYPYPSEDNFAQSWTI